MATRTVSNTGGNWNALATWVEGAIPTTADDVVFTATSGQLTITAGSTCKTLNLSNYVNTITFTSGLSVVGNINLGTGGYTQAGASVLGMGASGTLTSNGVVWSRGFNITAGLTCTLADAANISGVVTLSGTTITLNGFSLTCSNNAIYNGSITGTTQLLLTGTSKTLTVGGAGITNDLTITGSYTQSGNLLYKTGTLTTTAGSLTAAALSIIGGCTLNCSNVTWTSIGIGTGFTGTVTLTSDLVTSGNFSHISVSGTATFNGSNLYIGGGLSASSGRFIAGTTNVIFNGTGLIAITGGISTNVTINTAGTLTGGATIIATGGTWTYTAGTWDFATNNTTFYIQGNVTMNTSGMTWRNITTSATPTVTLNSALNISNLLSSTTSVTYAGTSGWTTGSYSVTTISLVITFAASKTYTVTNALTLTGTNAANVVFASSTPGTRYNFTLSPGATQDVSFVNVTDADSSLGQTIWEWKGTRSNTVNWNLLTAPLTVSYTFSS